MGEECSMEVVNANKMLVGKPEGIQSHGKIIRTCVDKIKVNLNGIHNDDAD
jgi:hypothetical protein